MPKNTILRLVQPHVSEDTVRACKYLLQEAEAGRLIGISWAAHLPGYRFEVDLAGEAKTSPAFTQGAILKLLLEIDRLEQK